MPVSLRTRIRPVLLRAAIYVVTAALSLTIARAIPPGTTVPIVGTLTAEDAAPVAYATIVLLRADSSIVKGELSDSAGVFRLPDVAPGDYLLKVESIEYDTRYVPVTVGADASGEVTVAISLVASAYALDVAVVKGRRALVEIKADRTVFNVSSSPSASGQNALDLLQQAPGVQVDMDDNVLLQGRSGVQVYINGRPTRLTGADLATVLRGIPSDNVDAIDLITNPSARYEAEGAGGVIDIRLKRDAALGTNGSLASGINRGEYTRTTNALGLNYGGKRVRLSLDASHNTADYVERFDDVKRQGGAIVDLSTRDLFTVNASSLALGAEFDLGGGHSLNAAARGGREVLDGVTRSDSDVSSAEGVLREVIASKTFGSDRDGNYTGDLSYAWDVDDDRRLSADVSFGRFDATQAIEQPNDILAADRVTLLDERDTAFDTDKFVELRSGKVDYEHAFSRLTLATGVKVAAVTTDNDLAFYDVEREVRRFDESRSNRFTYDERVAAAYATANVRLSPKLTLDAGLRVENTHSRGQLFSTVAVDNKDVTRDYTDVFPNAGLSFDGGGDHSWSLAYGRRINRPNYQNLNPFIFPQSELVFWQGNPFLRPNYVTNYRAQYAFRQKLTIAASYGVTRDYFATLIELVGEIGNRITPRNLDRATDYNLSATYPQEITPKWDVLAFAEVGYQEFRGAPEGNAIAVDNLNYGFRVQNNVRLPWGLALDVTYALRSPWVWRGSVEIDGNQRVDFGLKRDLLDGKLQLRVTGQDIFRGATDFPYAADYGGIEMRGVYGNDNQRFGVGATYRFGNEKLKASSREAVPSARSWSGFESASQFASPPLRLCPASLTLFLPLLCATAVLAQAHPRTSARPSPSRSCSPASASTCSRSRICR